MPNDDLRVAIYARVSGEQQAKDDTIASQLEAVTQRVASDALECEPELYFLDDGYSGDILARPGLERLRDQAAAGVIDRLYVLDPDRFSRKYAYQVLILEELTRCGVEVVFLHNPPGRGPEENLLLQVQGMIAEYECAQDHGAPSPGQAVRRPPRLSQRAQRRPTATVTSASTRAAARCAIRSWPTRPGSCGRSSSGSARNDARSVRFADVSDVTAFPRGPANRPGTAR